MLEIHGEDNDLRAVAATPAPSRNSALTQRVRRLLGQEDAAVQRQTQSDVADFDENDMDEVPSTPVPASQASARARRYAMGPGDC